MASPELERHMEGEWEPVQLMDREAEERRLAILQRDAERERLLWLSLPGNDHPTYYSDSEADGNEQDGMSTSPTVAAAAADVEFDPYLRQAADALKRQDPTSSQLRAISKSATAQRYRYHPVLAADQKEQGRAAVAQKILHGHRSGNRGNKLKREEGVRYANRFKLSNWSDGKNEKEASDSSKQRTKALQRASIRSLLNAAASAEGIELEMAEGSQQQQLSDAQDIAHLLADEEMTQAQDALYDDKGIGPSSRPENLTSTSLAPTLLRPVLTPLALLESQTLRHTFRNPHIGALSKTALDLIESESVVSRALGRCFAAIESGGMPGWATYQEGGGSSRSTGLPSQTPLESGDGFVGSEGEHMARPGRQNSAGRRSAQSLSLSLTNLSPALSQLEHLFITPGGIDVPNGQFVGRPAEPQTAGGDEVPSASEGAAPSGAPMSAEGAQSESVSGTVVENSNQTERTHEDGAAMNSSTLPVPPVGEPEMTHLDVDQQRALVRAALECLYELAQDSREYIERLQEVREKLAQVKIGRARIWGAVRGWALGEVEDELEQRRNEQLPGRGHPGSGRDGHHHPHHHHHHNMAGPGEDADANGGASVDGSSTGTRGKSGRSGRSSRAGRGQGQEGGSSRSGR
ncbi:hypothetical protein OC846_005803 [Tilletia horrida]|uniref:Transcriptional regulatory protein RXT2 N-terminal domain-containing protein n=1 Tax=Tilletia horrida TaxID=155126 RepID=A0AAN6GKM8_9BASI|nr:hypothetical protein OC846_005803 [Tilletia horrida]